jgi:predicted RNA-binding protein with PIN domain
VSRDTLANMNYLIDGHNLIAHIPNLDLSMPDDEEQLIAMLSRYGEYERGKFEVYFDGAPVGQAGRSSRGRVLAYFVPESTTADEAIKKRLIRLGKSARSWTVVTSDHAVQAAAREMHAQVTKSEDFSRLLLPTVYIAPGVGQDSSDQPLSPDEVEEWIKLFKQGKSTK